MQNELIYIETVWQKGSFSKAAQALYLTQPALSLAIQKVENEIGMPLFDRSKKPLALTEAGQIYLDHIRQVKALEEERKNRLYDITSMQRGLIRIGATSYLISHILPPVLQMFHQKYPKIRLQIWEAGSFELREMLIEQQLDVIFISRADKDLPYDPHPGFQDHLILCVPDILHSEEIMKDAALTGEDIKAGKHLQDDCPRAELKCFSDLPMILLEEKYDLRRRADDIFMDSGIKIKPQLEVAQLLTARALSYAGLGATLIPDRAILPAQNGVHYYRLDHPQAVRNMMLVTNKRSYVSFALQRFMEAFSLVYSAE